MGNSEMILTIFRDQILTALNTKQIVPKIWVGKNFAGQSDGGSTLNATLSPSGEAGGLTINVNVAFVLPQGNAGRNTIPGPGIVSLNLSLQRTVTLTERVRMQFRMDANNILNHVNIMNFGTVVNSITYGVPTAAGTMRNLTATVRLNF